MNTNKREKDILSEATRIVLKPKKWSGDASSISSCKNRGPTGLVVNGHTSNSISHFVAPLIPKVWGPKDTCQSRLGF